jgi:alpha-D-ribose 1-methylphosphonate 5-triphosphate synthase subunit PhnH
VNAEPDLTQIGTGFVQPVFDSQQVFRTALQVLARPGEVGRVAVTVDVPPDLHLAAGATLLALLDQDTRLWLSPAWSIDVGHYLCFHTGCPLVGEATFADFALIRDPADLPALTMFAQGDTNFPDRSTTVILQVPSLTAGRPWTLAGPGIDGTATVHIDGLPPDFATCWNAQQRCFPCGVDLFLTAGSRLLGLPRTTRIGA